MAETPQTPIEIVKAAHLAEADRWTIASPIGDGGLFQIRRFDTGGWKFVEEHNDLSTAMERGAFLAFDAGYRAAIRALAEMEPTEKMREAAYLGEDAEYNAVFGVDEARAYILAAAEEGEQK